MRVVEVLLWREGIGHAVAVAPFDVWVGEWVQLMGVEGAEETQCQAQVGIASACCRFTMAGQYTSFNGNAG